MTRTLEQHLSGPGPKRVLAIDGGGARGLLALGVLKSIEDVLRDRSGRGDAFRLSDYFDLIAGTSTGSIVAAGLALGRTVDQMKALYDSLCPVLFPPTRVMGVLKPRRDAEVLDAKLREEVGDETLDTALLKTGLMVAAKRMDTDSAWVLTNNPRSKFWDAPAGDYVPNRLYPLRALLRASAAAPTFFEPVVMDIVADAGGFKPVKGAFVDGAIAGLNCPAFQAFMTAVLPAYGFGWRSGAADLLLISVGTGQRRNRLDAETYVKSAPGAQALEALKGLINETVRRDIAILQALSEPQAPWPINSEIGGLKGQLVSDAPLLSFQRYDASLEDDAVRSALNLVGKSDVQVRRTVKRLMELDCGHKDNLKNLYALGRSAGVSVKPEHFPAAFDVSAAT